MLTPDSLLAIAKSRFQESKILLENGKPDGAVYLCGYAIELMLKRNIVKVLNWDGYPENKNEFQNKQSFKVHDLDILLNLSGLEKEIQNDTSMFARWQKAKNWDSEIRYKDIGKLSEIEARGIIDSSKDILNFLANK